ncbi:hypothetical protein RZS28_00655 [Methylocapsa polymorpha]|uniref:Uncharacterized protein n=1 Tax=Methylocapsa polymorpha TaxID=3080828 RepID=A0ABZ0HSF7_9HYPH|nr:hypothetical protein RZS28_00655 [Methylocapsa sp. RX1]
MTSRERLPHRRRQESFEFFHAALGFTLGVGRYHDGRVGEIFLSAHKVGSPIEALARDAAIVLSIALQHGADLDVIRSALTSDSDGGPASLIGAAIDALLSQPESAP